MRPLTKLPTAALAVALGVLAALCVAGTPLFGGACAVGTAAYPTIESAVRNAGCAPINVPAGTYRENLTVDRSVTIVGAGIASTTIEGRVWVRGAGTDILFDGFEVDGTAANVSGCWSTTVDARGGATLDSVALRATHTNASAGDCRIFEDGFDFGSTNAWSSVLN